MNPVVKRLVSQSPKTQKQSTLDLFSLYLDFSLSRFRRLRCQATHLLDSRNPIYRNSDALTSFDFSTTPPSVGTSDFAISRILMQRIRELHPTKPRNGQRSLTPVSIMCHLSTLLILWPTQSFHPFGTSRFMISRVLLPRLWDFNSTKPRNRSSRVNPMTPKA
jgi:hypothetical protein